MPQLNSARLPVATETFNGGRLMPAGLGVAPMNESGEKARGGGNGKKKSEKKWKNHLCFPMI